MPDAGRISLVTGGSRGIGRAICLALANPGDVVAFNHFDPDDAAAEETAALLRDKGVKVDFKKFDVGDEAQVQEYFSHVVETYGGLDVLVNNAGITDDALLSRVSVEQFDRVMRINLRAVFICLQTAAKIMSKQRRGAICNISSIVGQIGNIGQINYSAAKAGVMGLTKSAAKELARRNVRVNCVAPGFIATDMTANLPEKVMQTLLAMTPMGRMGEPHEIADAVAYLCSDQASFITGQVLHVGGGMYM